MAPCPRRSAQDPTHEELTMATHETDSRPRVSLGPADAGRSASAEEFAEADYEAPWRYERENGRLVVTAPDGGDHVETSSPWLEWLIAYRLGHSEFVQPGRPERMALGGRRHGS